ncbi:MAG: TadE/TadG family type IV pilus assembly protein [Phenylobacterium sp.]|jgi:Flp pilus assembly protein TadG|uniref:TadE/TadG family type IV pilus assembly protein n=1 Tax=Phenylobacterium sp. TaxID=1871053 RepID=UPI002A35A845|nr:TadE/TadG family type IV pilus assembly protein [Phenylobacterium sp.]MDX9998020.1 pilus assembly protein [Phenylobacterium sp.]
MMARNRHFLRDRRGVAAVEFALIAPLMIALYFGLAELTMALMAEQRSNHLAAMAADLVAQDPQTTKDSLDDVMSTGRAVMAPFPAGAGDLKIRITGVVADEDGTATVTWSRATAGFATRSVGSSLEDSPENLLVENEGLVLAEVEYTHTPVIGYVIDQKMTFKDRWFARPRQSAQVPCSDCGD